MKNKRIIILLFFLLAGSNLKLSAQNIPKVEKSDTTKQPIIVIENKISEDPNYQSQISELNKQVSQLSQTLGDNKQAFYDSKLNFWNFILTAAAIIIAILGFFGYRSIDRNIENLKIDNEKSHSKSENVTKEIKQDLLQRIIDIKTDTRDFKNDQIKLFEKFENDSKEKIDKGLALELRTAIDKIMKESFSKELADLSEQVAELTIKLDKLTSRSELSTLVKPKVETNKFEGDVKTPITKNINNAFDE